MNLKCMSFNIQGHAAHGRPDHLPKIAEVITSVGPDVVGLQEVHHGTPVSAVHQGEVLASLTGMTLVFGSSFSREGGEYGNAILTRGEVTASTVHPLPGSGEPRSMVAATIAVDGGSFTFCSTHLAAWGRLLRMARLRQIARLLEIVEGEGSPFIVVGDFNVPPAGEEIAAILSRELLHLCGDAYEPTFPMTAQRLDYILASRHWSCGQSTVVRRGPSDHWPIVADLVLSGS